MSVPSRIKFHRDAIEADKRSRMKKVTKWDKLNTQTNLFEHNHLEDGHVAGNAPAAFTKEQIELFAKSQWRKQFGYLDMGGKYQPMRT